MAEAEFTTEELENEIWTPVIGFEGWYSVSDLGRVRRDKKGRSTYVGKILKASPDKDGYLFLGLRANGRDATVWIATIVAAAFLGPRPEGKEVNHKDTDKKNNRAINLEYLTHKENMEHAFANVSIHRLYGDENTSRTRPECLVRGERHHKSKLTEDQIREIRARAKAGETGRTMAADYPVGACMINKIIRGEYWQHVV